MRSDATHWYLVAALSFATGSWAATVTTTADSGAGSLREAIEKALPGETIELAVRGTITLTSGELMIDKDLTIVGPGATNLTVQRNVNPNQLPIPRFRIFHTLSGIVNISGVTATHGASAAGGGIYNATRLMLRDCVVASNSVLGSTGGGGIYNRGTLILSNCVIASNSTTGNVTTAFGGGLYNEGTVAAISCTIKENIAGGGLVLSLGGNQSRGGGVFNAGILGMTNCLVAFNSVTGPYAGAVLGAGVFNQGILALDSSTVGFNTALGAAPSGAGVCNVRGGTMAIVRTTISSNVAFAAPFERPPVPRSVLARGGGIANEFGVVNVESSTISGNAVGGSATSDTRKDFFGGGVWNLGGGTVTFNHATVTANIVSGGSEADGGGVGNYLGYVNIHNTIIAGNASAYDFVTGSFGASQSSGFNLIGSTNGPFAAGPNDRFNATTSELGIGPLRDNGGPTFTHALTCGSPAINAGDNADSPLTDQRGFPRIMGGVVDIGAYEAGNQPGEIVNSEGCSISDLCPCDGTWRNHGQYVTCVEQQTRAFLRQGLLTEEERGRVISAVASSRCGRQR